MTQRNHMIVPGLLLFGLFLSIAACSKNNFGAGSTTNTGGATPPPSGTGADTSDSRKGADFSTNTTNGTWAGDIVGLKAFWFYTWGTPLPSQPPQNCEFVPMFWGKSNVSTGNIQLAQQLKTQGTAKYVLGFNEPNNSGQSNMSVQDALALWPQLESIGLPLGSPATDWPTVQWFTDFM